MAFDPLYEQFNWEGEAQHFAILRLDPATGEEQARYEIGFLPMGLAWIGNDLWLSHVAERKLHRTKPI